MKTISIAMLIAFLTAACSMVQVEEVCQNVLENGPVECLQETGDSDATSDDGEDSSSDDEN